MTTRLITTALSALLVSGPATAGVKDAPLAAPAPPQVAGIVPGTTLRAEVELRLGESTGSDHDRVAYAAPSSLAGARRVLVDYFDDDRRVARVDVELATPIDPALMAARVGHRVHQAQDDQGRLVEVFFPSLLGLIHTGATAGTSVATVAYLSPRRMADLFVDKANEAEARDQPGDALTECDKAVLTAPEYARGYLCRGKALGKLGKADAALAELLAATKAPLGVVSKVRAYGDVARAYHGRGWKDRAYDALAEARRLDPTSTAPDLVEADLRTADGEKDDAVKALERATKLAPKDDVVLHRLADGYFNAERWAEAEARYRLLIDHNAAETFIYQSRVGYTLAAQRKYADAIPYYERAVKLDGTNFWNRNNLGDAYLNANRPGDALPLFEACLREKPDELIPARNRGYALLALKRPEEAQRIMEGLVHAHPQDSSLMVDVARTLAAQGDRKKALQWLGRAVGAGYRNFDFLRQDPVLAELRQHSRRDFDKLVGQS